MTPEKRNQKGEPFVYRVHDRPDSDKLKDFNRFIRSLGYSVSVGESDTGRQINQLMSRVKGRPEETIIGDMAIRSMAKAAYSIDNIGHFGLAFKNYAHFTSPIRRYSDLLVHRILFAYTNGSKNVYPPKELAKLCEHISQTERNAMDAERFSIRAKHIQFLQPLMGEIFEGIISGVTNFGIFVKLLENLAEGLVHVRDLDGDFYNYDEKKFALIGRSSRKVYKLGDYITVQLIRVDTERSMVDFRIIDNKDGDNNAQ
jgi:ribonuclease R